MTKRILFPACLIFFVLIFSGAKAQELNPKVYYTFDQSSGTTVADSSGNGYNGTADCGTCWETDGKFGSAYHFSGAQRIDMPAKDIAMTTEKGTVAFWINLPQSSISTINCIWWAGEYGGDMFGPQNEMHINSEFTEANIWTGGEIAFVIQDSLASGSYFLYSDPWKGSNPATLPSGNEITITDGTWHHVACTWNKGSYAALYIDGQPVWDTMAYDPNNWDLNLMTLGVANQRSSRRLNGYLDEFRLFDRALNASEITEIFNFDPDEIIEGREDNFITGLNIYPNPAENIISFNNELKADRVEIYNLTGEMLQAQQVASIDHTVQLNIEQLNSGLYLIRMYTNNRLSGIGKFAVE